MSGDLQKKQFQLGNRDLTVEAPAHLLKNANPTLVYEGGGDRKTAWDMGNGYVLITLHQRRSNTHCDATADNEIATADMLRAMGLHAPEHTKVMLEDNGHAFPAIISRHYLDMATQGVAVLNGGEGYYNGRVHDECKPIFFGSLATMQDTGRLFEIFKPVMADAALLAASGLHFPGNSVHIACCDREAPPADYFHTPPGILSPERHALRLFLHDFTQVENGQCSYTTAPIISEEELRAVLLGYWETAVSTVTLTMRQDERETLRDELGLTLNTKYMHLEIEKLLGLGSHFQKEGCLFKDILPALLDYGADCHAKLHATLGATVKAESPPKSPGNAR